MTVFPISWHQEGLANSKRYIADKKAQLDRMQADYDRHVADIAHKEAQIAEAIRQGKASFDPDKFGKKRRASEAKP